MSLTVLMNAGPWLSVPPPGYGGIENVIATLVPELRRLGVRVVLASVGSSTLPVDEQVSVFADGQFAALQRPYNQVCGVVPGAPGRRGPASCTRRDDIDLVHDHVEAVGLATLAAMGPAGPPALHTLHWDLAKHPALYGSLDGGDRVRVNGVSAVAAGPRPAGAAGALGGARAPVHPARRRRRPAAPAGQGRAPAHPGPDQPGQGAGRGRPARAPGRFPLVLAGPVGPYHRPADLAAAGDEARQNPDVRFFLDEVAPHVDGDLVRWVGTVAGQERDDLLASARASLFPLRWEEPGGTAVVESLALGTPVVATARGCLPELIEHGRTGLLTTDEEELGDLVLAAELLDPDECRRVAAQRFTPAVMAQRYVELYERVRQSASAPRLLPA